VSDFDGAAPVFYDPQSSAQTGDGSVAVETGSGDQCAATERNPASGSAPPPDVSDISDIAPTAAEMTPVEEPNALDDNGKPAPADESFASGPSGEFGGATPSEDERGSEADRVATTPAEKDVVSSAISSRFRLQKPRRLVNPGNAIPTVEAAEPRAAAGIERDTVPTS